ncbi:hypothetical protein IYQ_16849 [Aeromonas salmonicida subsp. salmonicida 01-B526]|uniref:Uncharacterized protein n=1 Tax=Aeromonas salmonicida subsp. salmonicida 01-B526 TaxID=1076135 RepID=A0ABP2MY10_AERSS|nr:hypothetical protein IYQ_16849 [Aeromonas salmonicida subsp. salmonicida 01-B526]
MPRIVVHYMAIKIHCIQHSFMPAESTGTGIEKEPILDQMFRTRSIRDIFGVVIITAE